MRGRRLDKVHFIRSNPPDSCSPWRLKFHEKTPLGRETKVDEHPVESERRKLTDSAEQGLNYTGLIAGSARDLFENRGSKHRKKEK